MQLPGIPLRRREPIPQPLVQPLRLRRRQRIQIRLDREEIAHRVPLRDPLNPSDISRRAVLILAHHGESHLVPSAGRQISARRHARGEVVGIRIPQPNETAPSLQRDRLQRHPVIARPHRPLRGAHLHEQIVLALRQHLEPEVQRIRILDGLIELAPHRHVQRERLGFVVHHAAFHVGRQGQQLAPGIGVAQRARQRRELMIDDRMHLPGRVLRVVDRAQQDRLLERTARQLRRHLLIVRLEVARLLIRRHLGGHEQQPQQEGRMGDPEHHAVMRRASMSMSMWTDMKHRRALREVAHDVLRRTWLPAYEPRRARRVGSGRAGVSDKAASSLAPHPLSTTTASPGRRQGLASGGREFNVNKTARSHHRAAARQRVHASPRRAGEIAVEPRHGNHIDGWTWLRCCLAASRRRWLFGDAPARLHNRRQAARSRYRNDQ